jgi:hypothetical protein
MNDAWYVYAIVPSSELTGESPPDGLDDAAVVVEREGQVAALASRLPAHEYSADSIETRTADISWLAQRASAHDRVVTWSSDRAPTVPLPMFSLYKNADGVHRMLRERQEELAATLRSVARGREYTLRIYRDENVLRNSLPTLKPELAARQDEIAGATPGQKYLLEKKLEQDSRDALKSIAREVAAEAVEQLERHSLEVARESTPRRAGDPAQLPLVLNASFLVAAESYGAFRATLTRLVDLYGNRGFRFDFTGPWPPYHFVGTRSDGE